MSRTISMVPGERNTGALVPYPGNTRRHSAEQISRIAESIRRFGFTVPLLIDPEGTVIAGHGRLAAAKQIGLTTVPVVVAEGWTESERRAYSIADNRLAEMSEWDDGALLSEIQALLDSDYDMDGIGLDDDFLARLIPQESYQPVLTPPSGGGQVTPEQMERAGERLDGQFAGRQQLLEVTCPHCGGEFGVER